MQPGKHFNFDTESSEPLPTVVRTAIILAAGMGVRLKDRGELTPKGCMCLGEKSIVEESVLRLLAVGIERIVIVTGHHAEQYEPLQDRYHQTVLLVHNPHFADSGSMYSLYCARHCVDEAFLLLESDLVYEPRALTTCLENPSENVVLLAGFSKTSDECLVETRNGRLVAISKNRESLGTEVRGEMVGICKISPSLFSAMLEMAEQRFGTTRHVDYETDCLVAAAWGVPISCPVVEDLVWCEIDDETHLARARDEIYPVVQRTDLNRELRDSQRLRSNLGKFKTVGFFDERELIIRHIHDLEQCAPELERQGYTVQRDVSDGKRVGCRIFREDSLRVPSKSRLRFPWIGIWEHEVGEDGLIALPPEDVRYRPEDFLPLEQTDFLGVSVGVPHNPTAVLNTYFGSSDWMEVCQLPYRDHRNGGDLTGFPDDKFKVRGSSSDRSSVALLVDSL
ncbi:MAG: phosphocholine cytidylyltransferase family protein [Gemmatimonadetes bacterium]|nr:phosphocholine cytidylyltransferase family protein [Gemmatimonadota bacterium]